MWDIKIIQGNSSDSLQNKYIFGTFIENCKVINLGYFYQKPGYSSIIRVDGTSWMAHSKLNFTKNFFTSWFSCGRLKISKCSISLF